MTAKEYVNSKFGSLVYFDVVEQDPEGFAKAFAQESIALEALLLNVWSKGVQTFACGNNHVMILPKKMVLSNELYAQNKFDVFMRARGVSKLIKALHKKDFIPSYNAYISFDPSTVPAVSELKRAVTKAMKKYKDECDFNISQPRLASFNEKKSLGFYFSISREEEFKNRQLSAMSDDEIIKSSLPPAHLFDKYFNIVNTVFEKHLQKHIKLSPSVQEKIDIISSVSKERISDKKHDEFKKTSLNTLIASAEHIKFQNVESGLQPKKKQEIEL